ncbi:MAG TPA: ParB/RepB/Spo0J family partition protein [Burkholderiaceae bacterium]|nr:ParB/RepB/Spo0J family partition protein [Burkholderiaceae bacterium]
MRALWPSRRTQRPEPPRPDQQALFDTKPVATGEPLLLNIALIDEDPNNPRTEFPDAALDELADDIRQRGILQPIVVHPADLAGRYRIHFGSMRLRAAKRCGIAQVPIAIRSAKHDPYAQVAENLKRHGLSPLDLARFIQSRVDAGESNATVATHLGMDQTTVAHHLALLDLAPELDDALKSGRCTSPRTLYELSKLHEEQPERAKALIAGDSEITRAAVATMRAERTPAASGARPKRCAASLLTQANSACARLELTLTRIKQVEQELGEADLAALRQRVANLTSRSSQGSDRQTP